MKPHRVTIKYKQGEQTCVISKEVPACNERQAIDKVIESDKLAGKEVVSKKAELITLK